MTAGFFQKIDDVILDRLFQPVSDRLPERLTAWNIGINFELGSVVLQVACLLAPILLYGASVSESVQSVLVLLCSVMLFIGFQKFRPLVRPDRMNPLRPMMRSLRLICLAFLIYEIASIFLYPAAPSAWLWNRLAMFSQLAFVIGLYFMACQPRPPGSERRAQERRAQLREVMSDGV